MAVVTVQLHAIDMRQVQEMAALSALGGTSAVRPNVADRQQRLAEDQIVGHLGALAACKHLFGTAQGYLTSRWYANQYPTQGDGGSDIPGANVDVKTSMMRGPTDPMAYRLAVRQRERHEDTVYILALVREYSEVNAVVHLVGWAEERELPAQPDSSGAFAGAFVIPAFRLHPIIPFRWWVMQPAARMAS